MTERLNTGGGRDPELDKLDEMLFRHLGGDASDISGRLQAIRQNIDVTIVKTPRRTSVYHYIGIAAAVLIAVSGLKLALSEKSPVTKSYTTQKSQLLTVSLPDGSTARLAPATTLQVTGREVTLTGEAIFTVDNKKKEPFLVRSGNVVTRVLGTTFGVRAYDNNVRIVVSEGRVNVDGEVAGAGDLVSVNNGEINVQHNANVASLTSWSRGTLTFESTPLSTVLTELSRWYNLEFVASDPDLLGRRLTASIGTDAVPNEMLDLITSSLGMRYARVGQTVTLYPEKQ